MKASGNKRMIDIVATNFYGWAMSEPLPYDETKFDRNVILEDVIKTPHDWAFDYFLEVDLNYPDKIK